MLASAREKTTQESTVSLARRRVVAAMPPPGAAHDLFYRAATERAGATRGPMSGGGSERIMTARACSASDAVSSGSFLARRRPTSTRSDFRELKLADR